MNLPPRPTVYEINTAVWLEQIGQDVGHPVELGAVPEAEWETLATLGVDAVWLMGVWKRSPAGLHIALTDPQLEVGNRAALPDLRPEDVIGSPYCVGDYVVDVRFGGPGGLAEARAQLASRGLGLILDYVPNHVAPDHPWVTDRPHCFLPGSDEELADHPEAFIQTDGGVLAKGRDPYFPPWPDVVQLNAFSPELREAVSATLIDLGNQCDGLRCDMAMLMTNEVFARTWGARAGAAPDAEYWPPIIQATKAAHPGFVFIAEAYWDMEWTLQQHGFDFCYDKRLYDRLAGDQAESVRGHLQADAAYQERLIRFIENHDEPRAAATFASDQARAAAVVMSTLPGARLYHQGQLDGHRTRIPVFLNRGPAEAPDVDLSAFYRRLMRAVIDAELREGQWSLCELMGWPDNQSCRNLVAWCWQAPSSRNLVVVNLSADPAEARVQLPWDGLGGRPVQVEDRLDGQRFERDGDALVQDGLYVGLDGWKFHFLRFPGPQTESG